MTDVAKANGRRPLRPNLDVINRRPELRAPEDRPGVQNRVFRRWANGTLDHEGALHAILDVLWKLRDGATLTPLEEALASVVLPPANAPVPQEIADLTVNRLSDEERRTLTTLVIEHLLKVARALGQQTLARSASAWAIGDVRTHLVGLLAADPFKLGTAAAVQKALGPRPGATGAVAPQAAAGTAGTDVAGKPRFDATVLAHTHFMNAVQHLRSGRHDQAYQSLQSAANHAQNVPGVEPIHLAIASLARHPQLQRPNLANSISGRADLVKAYGTPAPDAPTGSAIRSAELSGPRGGEYHIGGNPPHKIYDHAHAWTTRAHRTGNPHAHHIAARHQLELAKQLLDQGDYEGALHAVMSARHHQALASLVSQGVGSPRAAAGPTESRFG